VSFSEFGSPAVTPVLAVAQTLNEVLVRFGVTVKLIDALVPGANGLAAEIPKAAALQLRVVVAVWVQPAGTLATVSWAPSCAVSSRLGFESLVGPRFVTLAVIVVDLPAWM
jgi:hypothetical protein